MGAQDEADINISNRFWNPCPPSSAPISFSKPAPIWKNAWRRV